MNERSLGGSCDLRENPSRSSVPEYDPVAGANFKLNKQMPDERQEIRIKRPASHTMLSAFYFYTTVCAGAQGDVYDLGSLAPQNPVCGRAKPEGY